MKKVLIILLCLVLSCFALIGCTPKDEKPTDEEIKTEETLPNLADCEIGYEFKVVGNENITYKCLTRDKKEIVVVVDKISITLKSKNSITPGDILDKPFYPYTAEMSVSFHVKTENIEPRAIVVCVIDNNGLDYGARGLTMIENNVCKGTRDIGITENCIFYFSKVNSLYL